MAKSIISVIGARQVPPRGQALTLHLLPYHCLDVAAVGKAYMEYNPHLWARLVCLSGLESGEFMNWFTFLLAIHDIGKFSEGFQNQRPDLFQQLQQRQTYVPYHERHDTLGYRFCLDGLTSILMEKGNYGHELSLFEADLKDLLKPWLWAVTGHHGRPPKNELSPQPLQMCSPRMWG